jgi:uncharacterized protein (UPF0248 family)
LANEIIISILRMSKKQKTPTEPKILFLQPSDKIIDRIRWDSSFDISKLNIGYLDRFVGLMWTDIEGFDIGDIPFHRIILLNYDKVTIWDRQKKIDLITGRSFEDVGKLDYKPPQFEQDEVPKPKIPEKKVDETIEIIEEIKEEQEEENKMMIPEDSKKEKYKPTDYLESWMLQNNTIEFSIENPTHTSQKGAYYHIDNSKMEEFYNAWTIALQDEDTPFYIKEIIDKQFKLNIDVDILLQKKEKYDIVSNGWMKEILEFTNGYFKESNSFCLLSECHGDYKEPYSPATIYKSGYHLYFPFIYVDKISFVSFVSELSEYLKSKFSIENLSKDVTFKDVIDSHIGTRIFGSNKWKGNEDTGRKHKFIGVFSLNGENKKVFQQLNDNLFELVQLTQSNIVTQSLNHERKKLLKSKIYTKDGSKDIDSHVLLPDYLEDMDVISYE